MVVLFINKVVRKDKNNEKYVGIFKVDWNKINRDIKEIYKETLEERMNE